LSRLLKLPYDGDEREFSDADRNALTFINNRIYRHKVIRFNYTTYDVRRTQDSVNPRTHADIMVLSREEEEAREKHPYWYARVIGIFHANVRHTGPASTSCNSQSMQFLWVRWFGHDLTHQDGWKTRRLPRIGFVDSDDPDVFGFLDPNEVIRAVHLIPAFNEGRTASLLGPSIARQEGEKDSDWTYYYVGL
jgi:hypothetical protein